jgi:hypothetical protein|tara:strand:+ start:366 stop:647 length:282 start_codon:yes stop_codon:yes gene_type:complete
MTRYHATPEGNVAFTAEEELEWDKIETAWNAGASERKSLEIREDRNARLQQTDWMASSDLTMSDEWKTYRQALRDVTSQEGFPNDVNWPTEPS